MRLLAIPWEKSQRPEEIKLSERKKGQTLRCTPLLHSGFSASSEHIDVSSPHTHWDDVTWSPPYSRTMTGPCTSIYKAVEKFRSDSSERNLPIFSLKL